MSLPNIFSSKIFQNYFLKFKNRLLGVVIAIFFTSFLILILGKVIGHLVNKGFIDNNVILINNSIFAIILIILGISIASFTRAYTLNSICEKIITEIRGDIYKKLLSLPISYYEKNKVSDINTRIINDASLVAELIGTNFPFAIRHILTSIIGIILLFLTNFKLAIYVTILVPVVIVPIIIIAKFVKKYSGFNQENISNAASHIDETISNIKTVQIYGRENYETRRFENILENNLNNALLRIKYKSLLVAIVILLISSGISIILWMGYREVMLGNVKSGDLTSFIYYAIIVASSISGLSEISANIMRLNSSLIRLNDILSIEYDEAIGEILVDKPVKIIRFENISFYYPMRPEVKILDSINFEINQGEKIAIIGPSGSGKTTIFQLLLKFYTANEGSILINGENIDNISTSNIRNIFSLVSQDPVIFSSSIYENIKYGKLDASNIEINEVASNTEILDFADALPDKIHTKLGEKGVGLSGGEKQRIAIARALIKDTEILLLDEPTNSLDKQTEEYLQNAFADITRDKTSIIITHNPSILKWIDKIIVINDGKIEAIGTYNELLNSSNFFTKFVEDIDFNNIPENKKLNTLFFN